MVDVLISLGVGISWLACVYGLRFLLQRRHDKYKAYHKLMYSKGLRQELIVDDIGLRRAWVSTDTGEEVELPPPGSLTYNTQEKSGRLSISDKGSS